MKGFLEEYGTIIVVVAVILLMLLFGKSGYAKSIQDAILGSADHIVETGENITKPEIHVNSGDTLNIEGTKYVVLEGRENSQALVMNVSSIGDRAFHERINYDWDTELRPDGQRANTYEGSDIDKYLENTWYKGLSAKMQNAIQSTNIKQDSHSTFNDPDWKQDAGANGQVYNTISRHVFLPSVSEVKKAVDFNNNDKIKAFLHGTSIWTRTSIWNSKNAKFLNSNGKGYSDSFNVDLKFGVRPAFVIDLSKVDYTEAGHVDYK